MSAVLLCQGTALALPLRDASVHCVVTSPPYWGLRKYDCGPGELGMEPSPDAYIDAMVQVFREVRRVLRDDGTCWVNMGDVMREKQLMGMPWRFALAMQADGWVLRSEVIWAKKNSLPESVRDRPTRVHEQIFLFSKAKHGQWLYEKYKHLSEPDARWLALFIDTEGNIVIRRDTTNRHKTGAVHHSVQVAVANTCRALLERAQAITGGGTIHERPISGRRRALIYYWQLSNKDAAALLYALSPHFIVKQRQAQCALYLEGRKKNKGKHLSPLYIKENSHYSVSEAEITLRDKLWTTVKSLNNFGTPDLAWVPLPALPGKTSTPYAYFYDATAVAEPSAYPVPASRLPSGTYSAMSGRNDDGLHRSGGFVTDSTRACRSVWSLASEPFSGSHFSTFPTALVRRCLLAGAPTQVCAACGAPYRRVVERQPFDRANDRLYGNGNGVNHHNPSGTVPGSNTRGMPDRHATTLGFSPTCVCQHASMPCTILDPFCGSGTTLLVARELGHHAIGIDLSWNYLSTIARKRLGLAQLAAWTGDAPAPAPVCTYDDLPLFGG